MTCVYCIEKDLRATQQLSVLPDPSCCPHGPELFSLPSWLCSYLSVCVHVHLPASIPFQLLTSLPSLSQLPQFYTRSVAWHNFSVARLGMGPLRIPPARHTIFQNNSDMVLCLKAHSEEGSVLHRDPKPSEELPTAYQRLSVGLNPCSRSLSW